MTRHGTHYVGPMTDGPATSTPTATTTRCCAPIAGGPRRTRRRTCSPCCDPTDRVLDVGVGPGTITVDLASRLAAGSVVGIDNAAAAVAATRELADRAG